MAATLLMRGTTEFSRVNSNSVDTAVLLYHGERGFLLACLDVILKTAKDASISEEIRLVCYQFTQELLHEAIPINSSQTITFVAKLLKTLNDLSQTITSLVKTGSVTNQVPEAGSGKLGEDISELRIERLSDERVYIVQILYHIISLFNVDTTDKLKMLELLEEAELTDNATAYMIIALVSALSSDNQPDEETPSDATLDFIDRFHNRIMTHGSKVPAIKAVIVLQWILYLSDPSRVSTAIGDDKPGRSEVDIQQLIEHCLYADVFGFMNEYLLYFQQPNAMINTDRSAVKQEAKFQSDSTKVVDTSDYHNCNANFRTEFQPFVVYELEKLGLTIISVQFSMLQKLKYKEEDTNTPVQAPLSTDNVLRGETKNRNQCYQLQYFLTFLASVFRYRVNEGVIFWNREQGGLHHFIRWLLDVKVIGTVGAAFDLFGSISTGDISADNMFRFLKLGMETDLSSSAMFSWGKPFAALQFYANQLNSLSEESHAIIPEVEEQLLLKFLVILKQCVQYSAEARIYFWEDPMLSAQHVLVNLLNCKTSTTLRAALFDVLAAFCSAWGGGVNGIGREISRTVWKIFENSNVLISHRKADNERSHILYQPAGLLREFEVEKSIEVYSETLSVIRVIGSAIHTQTKLESLQNGFNKVSSSIPLDLGKGSKNPGATPYISLVVDDIFVSLDSQKFRYPEARWELTDACLMVMENSLISFDVSEFENESTRKKYDAELKTIISKSSKETNLLAYLTHPGFQVIIRILTGGRVVDELFSIVEKTSKKGTKDAENAPYHKKCLVRSLRILHRVLQLQNTVCKILVPYISGFSKKKSSSEFQLEGYTFGPLPSVVPLGQLILFHADILKRIALLVNYDDQEEVCFLSTKILEILSASPNVKENENEEAFSRTVASTSLSGLGSSISSYLKASDSATAIIFGISERLSIDIPEIITGEDYEYDINNIPFWFAEETLKNIHNYPLDFKPRVSSSVRIAILDLLLNNVTEKSLHTLTEFLLGYDIKNHYSFNQIRDTESNRPSLVCFHTIINLLQQGVDRNSIDDAMMEDNVEPTEPLIDTHPILAEKCYELIYKLCSNKSLSISTLRYLRNREDFFYKQFDALTARIEHNIQVERSTFGGLMISADGSQYRTDFFKLRSKLHQRTWLLQSIALELHTTISTRQKNETSRLLDLLYGRKNALSDDTMDTSDDSYESTLFAKSQSYQQPLVKMLELISSLEFTWVDDLRNSIETSKLSYFEGFNTTIYLIKNERGCEVYDVRAIYKALKTIQNTMDEGKRIESSTELQSILSWVIAQNHGREIAHAKLACLKAWKEVVHITFAECSDLTDQEFRESIIYELLTMILPRIMHAKDYDGSLLESMSDIVLTLVDQLRFDKSNRPTSQLPIEKLKFIFGGIVDCIRKEETTIRIRGDLYSAITSFLLYIKTHSRDQSSQQLEQFILDTISSNNHKLLTIICNDAFNELDIWKTTAYIVLDALNTMALRAKSDIVQQALTEKNFLQATIYTIRQDDAALTNLLEQTDGKKKRETIYVLLFIQLFL